jgi:putative oxidoreductase
MLASLNLWFTRLTHHPDAGKFLLRATVAILMLFHGVAKLQHGVGWIGDMLAASGYPAFIAYGVYFGEIIAPLFILFGVFTRPMAFIMAVNMLVATLMVGMGKFYTLTNVGAWALEIEAFYFFACLVIMLLGSGRFSVMKNEAYR